MGFARLIVLIIQTFLKYGITPDFGMENRFQASLVQHTAADAENQRKGEEDESTN